MPRPCVVRRAGMESSGKRENSVRAASFGADSADGGRIGKAAPGNIQRKFSIDFRRRRDRSSCRREPGPPGRSYPRLEGPMLIAAFAFDYDGTIAEDGKVGEATVAALRRLKGAGRKILLVTGRELPDLQRAFPLFGEFDLIVAENG